VLKLVREAFSRENKKKIKGNKLEKNLKKPSLLSVLRFEKTEVYRLIFEFG
jgi:hypothetical protein